MALIYGVAERAAELILNPPGSSTGSKTTTGSGSSATDGSSSGGKSAGVALAPGVQAKWAAVASVAIAALVSAL